MERLRELLGTACVACAHVLALRRLELFQLQLRMRHGASVGQRHITQVAPAALSPLDGSVQLLCRLRPVSHCWEDNALHHQRVLISDQCLWCAEAIKNLSVTCLKPQRAIVPALQRKAWTIGSARHRYQRKCGISSALAVQTVLLNALTYNQGRSALQNGCMQPCKCSN